MRRPGLNLARRPFSNSRSVVRLALLLWFLGALLFGGNLWLYWDFLSGRGTASARLAKVNEDIVAADNRISQLSAELSGFNLPALNAEVEYLNARIDQRLFSWSQLFDRLARVVPGDARLLSLAPAKVDRRMTRELADSGKFFLQIEGQARTGEAILEFVDRLYEDPSFDRPNLSSESQDNQGLLTFQLTVPYDPSVHEPQPAPAEPEPAPPMVLAPAARPASSSLELEK